MPNNLTTATTRVRRNLKDTSSQTASQLLSDAEIQDQIAVAVIMYSYDKPRVMFHEIAGNSTAYEWALPTDWEADFSRIVGALHKKVEYPAAERVPDYLDDEDWIIYDKVTPNKFRLLNHTPGSSEKVRFAYTIRHFLSDANPPTSIIAADYDALIALSTALCCEVLATKEASNMDATLAADMVTSSSVALRYAEAAREWRKVYDAHLGLDAGVRPLSQTADFDLIPSWPEAYGTHMTHDYKRR